MTVAYLSNGYRRNTLLLISHLLLAIALLLWFSPATHAFCVAMDIQIFRLFNDSLLERPVWQTFWGFLNHRRETTYNLAFAFLLNVLAIWKTKDPLIRKTRIKQLIYFWCCFQIGFMLQEYCFTTLLHVVRHSPSLAFSSSVKLSILLQDHNIKDLSERSFPSGHAFSLIYWASFSLLCSPRKIGIAGMSLAIFMCFPRLFSGAHWPSDVIFSALLAITWLSWTIKNPLYDYVISREHSFPNILKRFLSHP